MYNRYSVLKLMIFTRGRFFNRIFGFNFFRTVQRTWYGQRWSFFSVQKHEITVTRDKDEEFPPPPENRKR